jgi:hypothetical protein
MTALAIQPVIKQCTTCSTQWLTLQQLVEDRNLKIEGYQACFGDADAGLIILTHKTRTCGTTLVLPARVFRPLIAGCLPEAHMTLSTPCPRRCSRPRDFEACQVKCDMAWVREVLGLLRRHEWPEHLRRAAARDRALSRVLAEAYGL